MKLHLRMFSLWLFTALALLGCIGTDTTLHAQIISTIAGTGGSGFSGDGGAAAAAKLNQVTGVTLDGSGNVYIADRSNNCIRKITAATGVISTIAGTGVGGFSGDGGAAAAAQLDIPFSVAVDGSGNVYIADTRNHHIRKIMAANGVISTIAGSSTTGNYGGDGGAATAAKLYSPMGIAVDGSGNIYIADQGNRRIRKITAATGIISTIAGTGVSGSNGDGGAATAAQLDAPSGVAVDGSGNVYITDFGSHYIRKITAATGFISTIAGTGTVGSSGDGGAATAAQLNQPSGVAVDGSGNVYIADQYNYRIRKITAATGIISTIAGTGVSGFSGDGSVATAAQLNFPAGVALDGSGNVYIADQNNHRIRRIGGVSNGVEGIASLATIAVYPTLNTGVFVLELSEVRTGAIILVTDVAGQVIATKAINKGELPIVTFDLRDFAKGIYLVQVRDGLLNYRTRIVVQ